MKKRSIIIISIIVAAGLITWLLLWISSPASGRISPSRPSSTKESTKSPSKKLDGDYVSFSYSGEYVAKKETATNSDLERYTLNATTQYTKQMLVSVVTLPEGQLKYNGDYIYRQKSPSVYTSRKFEVSGSTADIWVKSDGTEQTAMVPRDGKAAVLSLVTAPGANVDLTSEMNSVLKTLEWKK